MSSRCSIAYEMTEALGCIRPDCRGYSIESVQDELHWEHVVRSWVLDEFTNRSDWK